VENRTAKKAFFGLARANLSLNLSAGRLLVAFLHQSGGLIGGKMQIDM
jgi:hypothetical protein